MRLRSLLGLLIGALAQAQVPDSFASAPLARSGLAGALALAFEGEGEALITVNGRVSPEKDAPPLERDAVFDVASLTKPLAAATVLLELAAAGVLGLEDPVARHWPEFAAGGKGAVTLAQILRHRGGLPAANPLGDFGRGPEAAFAALASLPLQHGPGERFLYSDCGYLVLGHVLERATGEPLDRLAARLVFEPLGMRDTRFVRAGETLPAAWQARVVPTERIAPGEPPLRAVVHDPRARALGGVAGHAGLFSTARDLEAYMRCLLRHGRDGQGRRVLAPETVRGLGDAGDLPRGERRGLGFDVDTPFSTPRGPHFGRRSFGHTGFTGTSMWLDPEAAIGVVLLASRLQDGGTRDLAATRAEVAAAAWLRFRPPVRTGLDRVLAGAWPSALAGAKVGLITNRAAVDGRGQRGIDGLRALGNLALVRLFSPEHGLDARLDEAVGHGRDPASGLLVFSLYGETRAPTPAMLEGLDALVFDVPDAGTRFYTYSSTLVLAQEAAAARGIPMVVLDRPNPIGGEEMEGPIADASALDFVGCLEIPVRHGMTLGELARFAAARKGLPEPLVVTMEGWRRDMLFRETGLPWVDPSPNMRSEDAALLYPGIGLLETTGLSVGRGTETPFLLVGAPGLDGMALTDRLRARAPPGVLVHPCRFTPEASTFRGQPCGGVRFTVVDPRALRPVALGLALAEELQSLPGFAWDSARLPRLLKSEPALRALRERRTFEEDPDRLARFRGDREAALLYRGS